MKFSRDLGIALLVAAEGARVIRTYSAKKFLVRMKEYNRQYLPNFMTITTSITAKLI